MSELGALFNDVTERIFSDFVTQELLEKCEEGEWPEDLWNAVFEAGLPRALLRENEGGAGARWSDLAPVLMTAGRHAAPIPLAESLLAAGLLRRAGLSVPEGLISLIPRPLDKGMLSGTGLSTHARGVPWGRKADHLVFVAPAGEHSRVGLLSTRDVTVEPRENIAREPRDDIRLRNAQIEEAGDLDVPADVLPLYGAMIRSAQMAGALEALLEMSVGYAGEREQFGRPIGKFQAIQQELARLAGEVAATGMAAKAAFFAADRAEAESGFDPTLELAAAKIRLGDAADLAPGIAHQVHGAIGFTYEHKLHFFTRRLWAWRVEFGTASQWADRLGALVEAHGADGLWPWITSR